MSTMDSELKNAFLSFLTDLVNDFGYSEIDGFVEEHEIEDENVIGQLLSMRVTVTIQEGAE